MGLLMRIPCSMLIGTGSTITRVWSSLVINDGKLSPTVVKHDELMLTASLHKVPSIGNLNFFLLQEVWTSYLDIEKRLGQHRITSQSKTRKSLMIITTPEAELLVTKRRPTIEQKKVVVNGQFSVMLNFCVRIVKEI